MVRDTETRYTNENMCIARFTLAVDRRGKDKEADFISCVAFGKTGEVAEKYLKKGMKVAIEGRWQTGSYQNKEGQKVYTNECIIDQLEFVEKRETTESTSAATDDFMNVPEDISDEVPFV